MGALVVQIKAWLSKGRVCRAAIAVVETTSNSSLEDTAPLRGAG